MSRTQHIQCKVAKIVAIATMVSHLKAANSQPNTFYIYYASTHAVGICSKNNVIVSANIFILLSLMIFAI